MSIVSRVQFPSAAETADLYIKLDTGALVDFMVGDRQIKLRQGNVISFNTYFNSIYEKFYTKYTTIIDLDYLLRLEGDFEIFAYRETHEEKKELIYQQVFKHCQLSNLAKISLPELKQNEEAGRIYLEIQCLSEQGLFKEGFVVTDQEKQREIALGVITCTFKKEAYVTKTINTILQDELLQDRSFKIFIVDNGKTLEQSDFKHDRIELIPNRNVGGSGGFTKGLIEALQEDTYTHFLFMDDDIELDSEVIYRLFPLYEYAKQDFAVAGSMIDLFKKHILFEAGSMYNRSFDAEGQLQHRPFTLTVLKHNLDLSSPTSINSLLLEDDIDYGGFWFFCFSREVVDSIGLPLPFFIKIDDMEYGLRIRKYLDGGIVAFPSIAVWHEPFYAKKPVWDFYYCTRNELITDTIHHSLDYFNTIRVLTTCIIYHLLLFDYNSALMFIKGLEDYMKGPSFIRENDPEVLHSNIHLCSKSHRSQTIAVNSAWAYEGYQVTKTGKLQKLASLLTLNGHLLPQFLLRDESAIVLQGSKDRDSVCKGLARRKVTYIMENNPCSYQNEIDHQAATDILLTWIKVVINSSLNWARVNAEWKKSVDSLTSVEFWQTYLESSAQPESIAERGIVA